MSNCFSQQTEVNEDWIENLLFSDEEQFHVNAIWDRPIMNHSEWRTEKPDKSRRASTWKMKDFFKLHCKSFQVHPT